VVTTQAAGGASPLAVPAVGSGVLASVALGPVVAPSVWVVGVVPSVVPVEESEDAPPAVVVPVTSCAFGVVPVTAAPSDPVDTVPAEPATVWSADVDTTDGTIVPVSPVVPTVSVDEAVFDTTSLETVPMSEVPIIAVCAGGVDTEIVDGSVLVTVWLLSEVVVFVEEVVDAVLPPEMSGVVDVPLADVVSVAEVVAAVPVELVADGSSESA
jgi:hypothetical protein